LAQRESEASLLSPSAFYVQFKHLDVCSTNSDGSISLSGLEVADLRFWQQSRLPVLLSLFLLDQSQLYCKWASELPDVATQPDQTRFTTRFHPGDLHDTRKNHEIASYLEALSRYVPPPRGFISPPREPKTTRDELLQPNDDALRWFTAALDERKRFVFLPSYSGKNDVFLIRSYSGEQVGINRHILNSQGAADFTYQTESQAGENVAFFALAIRRPGFVYDEIPPRNAHIVPADHHGDGHWHRARIEFDFTHLPDLGYTVLAVRLNEQTPHRGPGAVYIHSMKLHDHALEPAAGDS
jgi:hypothetical protein